LQQKLSTSPEKQVAGTVIRVEDFPSDSLKREVLTEEMEEILDGAVA
jgi:hypothetical protein